MPNNLALRAFDFTPSSIDEQARTVELVASTGAGVLRRDMEGEFREVLSLGSGAVDLSRADGMPLLDSHRQDALDRVLGVVRGVRLERDQLIVKVEFSARPAADAIFRDVRSGIIRNVSIGYQIDEFRDTTDSNGQRARIATRWTLLEVSLVPVGADVGAKTRGVPMPDITPNNPVAVVTTPPAPTPTTVAPPAPATRAQVNAEIRALAETFELGTGFADPLIDRNATIDEARAAAVDAVRTRTNSTAPHARVTVTNPGESPEMTARHMGEALYLRANPRHQISEPARRYAGQTTLDMARHFLQLRGHGYAGMSAPETITRALNTTSDFPLIFGDAANRSLRPAYDAAPAVLKLLARESSAKDFRAKHKLQISEAGGLEKVGEHGEYKYSSFTEGGESYSIDTFGRIFGISRKAIINDDVGAFADIAGKMGAAAAEFEAQFLVDLLVKNFGLGPNMADGNPLFHASRGNIAAAPLPPSIEALKEARLSMRRQTGLSGKPINVAPRYALAPADLETDFEKLLATIQPNKSDDVNPFGGKLELLVEARLTDPLRYYVVGDPARIEGLEYSYLQGAAGPQTDTRAGFEIDGVEVKVRLDFGAAFVDGRAWFTNEGDEVTE